MVNARKGEVGCADEDSLLRSGFSRGLANVSQTDLAHLEVVLALCDPMTGPHSAPLQATQMRWWVPSRSWQNLGGLPMIQSIGH